MWNQRFTRSRARTGVAGLFEKPIGDGYIADDFNTSLSVVARYDAIIQSILCELRLDKQQ